MNLFPYSILILPNVNSSQCWINSADVVRKMTSTMRLWHSALLFILASAVAVPQATAASGWNFVKRKFSWISYILSHKRTPKKGKEILQKFWIIKFTVIQKKTIFNYIIQQFFKIAQLYFSWSLLQCQKRIVIYYVKKFIRKSQ